MIAGIWIKACIIAGLCLLAADALLSLSGQIVVRLTVLKSDDEAFSEFKDAVLSESWSAGIRAPVASKLEEKERTILYS